MACADFLGGSMYKDYSLSLRKEVFIWDNETTGPLAILLERGVYGIGKKQTIILVSMEKASLNFLTWLLELLSFLKVYYECRGLG